MALPSRAPRRPVAPTGRRPHAPLGTAIVLALVAAVCGAAPGLTARTYAATSTWIANCNTNLRTTPKLNGTVKDILNAGGTITADGTVTGDSWSVTCEGDHASNTWFKIVAVNGKSTSSLYGVSAVYAATGLFDSWTAPTTKYLNGIDISHWQGTVDFAKVRGAGYRFVIAKATEGIGFTDDHWSTYRNGAKAAGLAVTGYHFARPDGNPTKPREEARWYVSQLNLQPGMIIPALDLERGSSLGRTALTNWVAAWLDEVYQLTGVKAMIYVSPSFWKSYLGDTRQFADAGYNVLWVAHWGVSSPSVPASNWGGKGWTFWQYTSDGSVPGISGRVDLNYYNGTDLTKVIYGANFSLSSAAALSSSIKQGATTTYDISIDRSTFTTPVSLSVSGAPAGATATLDTTSTTGSSATLTVKTSNSGTITPTGTYTLKVTGTALGMTRTTSMSLTVTDGIAPKASAPSSKLYHVSILGSSTSPVKSAWSATDNKGVKGYTVQRQVDGGSWTTVNLSSTTVSTNQSLTLGSSYRYRMQASDANGNLSAWAYGPTFSGARIQQTSSVVGYTGTWSSASSTTYSGGTVKYTKSKGAKVTYLFTGNSIAWVAPKSNSRGKADVYIDGVWKATVNLYWSTYLPNRIVFSYSWATNGTHRITVVNKATSGHPRIDVDAFIRLAAG